MVCHEKVWMPSPWTRFEKEGFHTFISFLISTKEQHLGKGGNGSTMILSIILFIFIITQGWFFFLFLKPLTKPKRRLSTFSTKNKLLLEQHVSMNEAEQNV